MGNKLLLDTNALVRFFTKDNIEQYNIVSNIISASTCYISLNVVQELIFVLEGKSYKTDRNTICNLLHEASNYLCFLEEKILFETLEIYKNNHKLDFVDCLLYVYHKKHSINVFSFDKDLNNILYN